MVMNLQDSCSNHHPTTTRGFLRTVNWNLNGAKFVICDHTIEQDHRAVKRITRPTLGFKSFDAAQCTLASVELMDMTKKRQMVGETRDEGLTAAAQFYSLAA